MAVRSRASGFRSKIIVFRLRIMVFRLRIIVFRLRISGLRLRIASVRWRITGLLRQAKACCNAEPQSAQRTVGRAGEFPGHEEGLTGVVHRSSSLSGAGGLESWL